MLALARDVPAHNLKLAVQFGRELLDEAEAGGRGGAASAEDAAPAASASDADDAQAVAQLQAGEQEDTEAGRQGDDLDDPQVRADIESTLALISELLNLGTTLSEERGVNVYEGFSVQTVAWLASLREALNERFSGPDELTINTAAPGQLPWEALEVDEARGLVWWGVDLTEGRAGVAPWRAAALSQATKREMARLHALDPRRFDAAALAREYGIREQRAAAILALQELEGAALAKEAPERAEAARRAAAARADEGIDPAREGLSGGGEAHVSVLPSFPNYQEVDLEAFAARLQAQTGKAIEDLTPEDLTPEVAAAALRLESKEEVEARLAAAEEARLVAEFRERLDFNLGRVGAGLRRRGHVAPYAKRPQAGWDLLVKPLKDADGAKPYVAAPDGSRRDLNEDEELLLRRQAPKPRRRIL